MRVWCGRPGRPAHPDAPGGVPGRGHQRPAAAGDRRAGVPAPARPSAPPSGRHRAWPTSARRRERRSDGARWTSRCPPTLEAHEPPEARGLARDGVRLLVGARGCRRGDPPPVHRPARPAARRATCSWSTRRRPCRPRCRWPAARPGRALLHRAGRTGRWLVELRRAAARPPRRTPDGGPGTRYRCSAAASVTLRRAVLGRAAVGGRRGHAAPAGVPAYLRAHGAPIRYAYVPRPWPLSYYQTVFATHAGQRRDAQRRPAVHRPAGDPAGRRRRARRAGAAAHRGRLAGGARAARTRSGSRCRRRPPGWSTPARAGGGRVIAVGTTVGARAGERGRGGRRGAGRRRAGPTWSSRRRAGCGWSTGC